jgi:hypothetical protein
MSVQSLSEAVAGALMDGESGKAYLVGDENITFAEFFTLFFKSIGSNVVVPARDQNHPLLPDEVLSAGRGIPVRYEPEVAEVERLAYRRGDVERAVREAVAQVLVGQAAAA